MENSKRLSREIRVLILLFISGMVISGFTAFPLVWELRLVNEWVHSHMFGSTLNTWISDVYHAVAETDYKYPFLSYGTDWLAFAHLVIAIAFIGPLRDPIKNIWVIEWGMIASLLVFPLAFIAGTIRQIPFFHQLIDCSFGVGGFLLLFLVRKKILQFQKDHSRNDQKS